MKKLMIMLLLTAVSAYAELGVMNYGGLAGRPSVRDLGSGEAFLTVPEEDNLMYNNPAGLNFDGFRITIPEINLVFDNDFVSAAGYVVDHQADFEHVSDPFTNTPEENEIVQQLIDDTAPFDGRWIQMGITPNLNVSYKNIGVGTYVIADPRIMIDQGAPVPKVFARANVDWVLAGAIGKRIYQNVAGGVTARYIERRSTGLINYTPTELAGMENTTDMVNDIIAKAVIPVRMITLTPGLLAPFKEEKLKLGAVFQDLVVIPITEDDQAGDIQYKPNIKVGASLEIPLKEATYFIRHIKVGGGLDDVLNVNGTNIITRTHLGGEMKVLAGFARAGLNGMLPSFGLGVDLWAVRADYVFFGKEKGEMLGQDISWNHMMSFRLGW